jgi:CheY-like chemotaxis protein
MRSVADHGLDAITALEKAHSGYLHSGEGLYDVVLMDLEMPGELGYDTGGVSTCQD